MIWPMDADGDVFRRLHEGGFDFNKSYVIDFNVDFEEWPPPPKALANLRSAYTSVVVYDPEAEDSGYVQLQVYARPSYDLVVRIQSEVSAMMAPFGGRCDSWGILH